MVDPSGEQTCPDNPTRPVGSQRTFHYDRVAAARAAFNISAKGFNHPDYATIDFERNDAGTIVNPSAIFMSLALTAGGFPMVKNADGSDSVTGDGWRASYGLSYNDSVLVGTSVWRNHNLGNPLRPWSDARLIGYIWGSTESGGNRITSRSAKTFTSIAVSSLLSGNASEQARTIDRIMPERLRGYSALYSGGIAQGDYLFIDTGGGATHGYLVVGFGPALTCESNAQTSLSGNRVLVDADSLDEFVRTPDGAIIQNIPYVADWGKQRNTPRPFYCSNFNDPFDATSNNDSLYLHNEWIFIRVPDEVSVPCENLFMPDFKVSPVGQIVRCG